MILFLLNLPIRRELMAKVKNVLVLGKFMPFNQLGFKMVFDFLQLIC